MQTDKRDATLLVLGFTALVALGTLTSWFMIGMGLWVFGLVSSSLLR